ncbi:MAG: hypothetical protein J5779_00840, partial [Clostridia bacterium]|nr:hypothetical protein [Clostridia bacterium]
MIYFFVSTFLLLLFFKNFLKKKQKAQKQISFALKSKRFFILSKEYKTLHQTILNMLQFNISNEYNQKIDFFALKNANLFENKEIFKIVVEKTNFWKKQFVVFKNLKQSQNFTLVFQVKNKREEVEVFKFTKLYVFKNFKIINLQDINFNLLFEINKLNINYLPKTKEEEENSVNNLQFSKPKLKNGCLACGLTSKKIECSIEQFAILKGNIFQPNSKIVTIFFAKAKQNACINFQTKVKLNSPFICVTHKGKNITITQNGNQKILHSNFNIKNIKKIKQGGESYLLIKFNSFSLNKNQSKQIILSEEKICFENVENLKLECYLNLKKLTNFNFLSKNEEKNAFFNKKLPIFIQKLVLNQKCCLNFQNKKLKNLEDVCNVFENFLGLKQCNNFLEMHPKFEFSINLN